jgi:hypothetical protein
MTDIDPREFGRLESEVQSLSNQVSALQQDVKSLLELANKSKGGFWIGMAIASAMGGVATFVAEKLFKP